MNNNINIDLSEKNPNILSTQILLSKQPSLNYYAILNLGVNKVKHLQVILDSKDPALNYACAKHCIKTKNLSPEEKKEFALKHSDIVLASGNTKIIEELKRFIKYNPIGKEYHPIKRNNNKSKTKHR